MATFHVDLEFRDGIRIIQERKEARNVDEAVAQATAKINKRVDELTVIRAWEVAVGW